MQFEEWDDSFLDLEDYQVERALTNAALDAIRRARQFGTKYVIWEDERVKSLAPHETGPHPATARKCGALESQNSRIESSAT
jgi:hypothetical protein